MLNERDDVRTILKDMTKSPDGISCIAACMLSIAMAITNALVPELFHAGNADRTGKWLAIWLVLPPLLFLLYLRNRQLIDGIGRIWTLVRSIAVLSPAFVLSYFNF